MRSLLAYVGVALLMVGPQLRPVFEVSTASYDFLDAHVSLWSLWWTRIAVEGLKNPFFSDLIFFPRGTSLAFHSFPFVYGLVSIPIQHAVPGKEGLALAFNALVLISFVASAVGAYLLALELLKHEGAAFIAGLIYAFMPYHVLNACRLAVAAVEVLPFYALALLRLRERPSWARAAALAAILAAGYYNSIEYALYLVLFSALFLAYGIAAREPGFDRRLLLRLAGAAAMFALLAAPLLVQQGSVAAAEGASVGNKLGEAVRWSPALLSFVTPSRVHPLFGSWWSFAGEFRDGATQGMRSETAIGWVTLLLAGAALARPRRDGRAVFALIAGCFFALVLGPYLRVSGRVMTALPLPYAALYAALPPFRAIKEPTRMFPMLVLMLALLAAYALRDLLAAARKEQAWRLTLLVGFAVLFEALTAWPWQSVPHMQVATVAPFYRELARDTRSFSIMDLSGPDATLIAQPVHAKPTTEWQAFIPRAGAAFAASPLFELEHALERPNALLQLPVEARRGQIASFRRALRAAGTRYVLLPKDAVDSPRRAWLEAMARLLGGSLADRGGLLVLELTPLLAGHDPDG